MTEFVLGSIFAGDVLVLSNRLAFRALLGLRYPDARQAAPRAANVIDAAARFAPRSAASSRNKGTTPERLAA